MHNKSVRMQQHSSLRGQIPITISASSVVRQTSNSLYDNKSNFDAYAQRFPIEAVVAFLSEENVVLDRMSHHA